jgi:hypothetical protein
VADQWSKTAENSFVSEGTDLLTPRDLTDHATATGDHKMQGTAGLAASDRHEFESLWTTPLEKANLRRYISCPISLQFAFLLACLSHQALELARKFIPLPSYKTIQNHYGPQIGRLVARLSDLGQLDDLIQHATEVNALPPATAVSLAVDAMAMTAERTHLPSADCETAFVIDAQPLDARLKCFPLHVMTHSSGRATAPVQEALERVTRSMTNHGLTVKYMCADADSCDNRRHLGYFQQWYPILIEIGFSSTLFALADDVRIPGGDCLHIWKTYCNKVKNHPVTLLLGSAEPAIRVDDLQSVCSWDRLFQTSPQSGGCGILLRFSYSAGRTA